MDCGSSPWVRRTPLFNINSVVFNRFISVGTENTWGVNAALGRAPVHLRGYGEHTPPVFLPNDGNGSSPWVRRTLDSSINPHKLHRFISVGTENTKLHPPSKPQMTVHLRGYGEHDIGSSQTISTNGSSPWVRRTRISAGLTSEILRFISVGTENTKTYRYR